MKNRLARLASRVCLLLLMPGMLQAAPPAARACPQETVTATDLIGHWQVTLGSSPGTVDNQAAPPVPVKHPVGHLHLHPHPEYPGSLRGTLHWAQRSLAVVADLDGEAFTLEESEDGRRISATWVGALAAGHCGQRIEGQRLGQGGSDTEGPTFRMQRR